MNGCLGNAYGRWLEERGKLRNDWVAGLGGLRSPRAPTFENYMTSNLGQHLEGHFLFKKEKRYSTR